MSEEAKDPSSGSRVHRPAERGTATHPLPDTCSRASDERMENARIVEQMELLGTVPALARLPAEVRLALAASLHEEHFPAGAVVIHEGEIGDRLYIVAEGRAEASIHTPNGPAAVQTYALGELFGELVLLDPARVRAATVTALTPLTTLDFSADAVEELLEEHPDVRDALQSAREDMLLLRFLKAASPFGRLSAERLHWLMARMTEESVLPGEGIVQQGEVGDVCFLLQTGQAEVILTEQDGSERQIAKLRRGAIIGEAALLTTSPRNATVRALEPCVLYRLGRTDLLAALADDRNVSLRVLELVQLRDRPKRVPFVVVQQRATPEGDTIVTLKDVNRSRYYRLSSVGLFVWNRLDGSHTLRDLTVEYLAEFKSFSPQVISEIIAGLTVAGFVDIGRMRSDFVTQTMHLTRLQRLLLGARAAAEWRIPLRGIDGALGRVYNAGVWPAYTLPGQIVLGVIALSGLVAFLKGIGHAGMGALGGWMLVVLLALYGLSIVLHELGHAFTVKAFGHEVNGAGIGWYWFGPVAYVDTSDMWLAGRWPRIAVTLGGLYTTVLVAAVSSLVATLLGHSVAAAIFWQLSLLSYLLALFNLDPMLEYDGYYILMDWLDRPGLRRNSLAWLGTHLPAALRDRRELARHRLELLYGLGAVIYVIVMAFVVLAIYRPQMTDVLHSILPVGAAGPVGWLLSIALVALALVTVVGDLRSAHS